MARRRVNVFSLSFLDCMSCGFGAVILFFMIINHSVEVRSDVVNEELLAEVNKLEDEVLDGQKGLVLIKNSIEEIEKEEVITEGLAEKLIETVKEKRIELSFFDETSLATEEDIRKLQADIQALEEEYERLSAASQTPDDLGEKIRAYVGDGDRQYLTGVKVGGKRIMILVDASASMLDETIVNVIVRRNLPDAQKSQSEKWIRTVSTVDWITTQLPLDSQFQLYAFNTAAQPLLEGTAGKWLDVADGEKLEAAMRNLRMKGAEGGTSLHNAFEAIRTMQPLPDNVFLITDGLPTQGKSTPFRNTVSGQDRYKHFTRAVRELPEGVPVNIVLFPMEGDPFAASAFWLLAQRTGGSFLSPAKDWP